MEPQPNVKKYVAEAVGTAVLVLVGAARSRSARSTAAHS